MGQFLEKPKVEKHNIQGKTEDVRFGVASMQGWRVDMEDAHATVLSLDNNRWSKWSYFGIFDGHAGSRTAIKAAEKIHLHVLSCLNSLVEEHLKGDYPPKITSNHLDFHKFEMSIKDAYFKFDNEWREENRTNNPDDRSGSTAVSCLFDTERVYFLNVGDSRGILVSTEGRVLLATKDHKPSDQAERQRIQEAGGTVLIQRVNGSLAVSRALGDFEYKNNSSRRADQQLVSPEPEITSFSRDCSSESVKQDEQVAFIVLACDGIWDVMTNEELAAYILGRMRVTDDFSEICNSVLDMCLYKGSKDNMSIILIAFKDAPTPTADWKTKDETLNNEIRKKTIELCERTANKSTLDANTVWQQVVTFLSDQASIRESLPVGGGFVSKRSVFENIFESIVKGTNHAGNSHTGLTIKDEHDDENIQSSDPSITTTNSSADIPSSTSNNLATLT